MLIADGWRFGDLETVDDCDAAIITLRGDVANINTQIELANKRTHNDPDRTWLQRARHAQETKQSMIDSVIRRKQNLRREEELRLAEDERVQIIATLEEEHGDIVQAARLKVRKGRGKEAESPSTSRDETVVHGESDQAGAPHTGEHQQGTEPVAEQPIARLPSGDKNAK